MYKESATERATSGDDAQSKALTIIAPLMVLAACKMKDKDKAKSSLDKVAAAMGLGL